MTQPGPAPRPRELVLVVDDEPDILGLNRLILEREGWGIITSGDGVDAIQKAMDRLPDAIVLDVMMPRMNGYQVCRLLKSDPLTAGIPIVICTVRSLESEKLYAYTSGADGYVVKPYDPRELVDVLRRLLAARPAPRRPPPGERRPTSTDTILSDVNRLLDRRLMELTILHHLTRAMTGTLDLDGVLQVVLQSIVGDLGYPGGMIFLLGEGGGLEERGARGEPLRVDPARHRAFGRALSGGEVVTLTAEQMIEAAPPEFSARIHSPAAVLVPIQARAKAIGLLVVETQKADVGRGQREFLLTLASQSALAIENADLYARTLRLSITDGMTGVANYRHFRERLDAELARSRRYQAPVGLLLIDIDRFKSFNDRYGHLAGDKALKAVAHALQENTRDVDVVARYGGEEFAVVLPESGEAEVAASAERIRAAVAQARLDDGRGGEVGVTVSVGAAVSALGDTPPEELVRRADQALYRAKEGGRDRVCAWRQGDATAAPAGA